VTMSICHISRLLFIPGPQAEIFLQQTTAGCQKDVGTVYQSGRQKRGLPLLQELHFMGSSVVDRTALLKALLCIIICFFL
jgi:hypothetical protein